MIDVLIIIKNDEGTVYSLVSYYQISYEGMKTDVVLLWNLNTIHS